MGDLNLVDAPGKAELDPRVAALAEEPLIDVGPLLFPWNTEEGDILDCGLPLVLPGTAEVVLEGPPLLPLNLLDPDGDKVEE